METRAEEQILVLNHQFYQTFAHHFSSTRLRLQPGIKIILPDIIKSTCILDLGCGNGELALALINSHFQGQYVGCDISRNLLNIAKTRLNDQSNHLPDQYQFFLVDLAAPGWEIPLPDFPYDLALSFAVLHHLPGKDRRLQLLSRLQKLLTQSSIPQSFFIFSVWQFLNSPRLRARIQPWSSIGISPDGVDSGDFLLDWRHGGQGLRYVHHFSEIELQGLADAAGFSIRRTFYSDGEEGNLGLYQVWETMRV
ncbi:MAG: class I SAM-dependent methyltransferase [Anaerolineales bacterium]|nr:class I SAM-dependent methyltransferase [Anaerolineales bacterium]